MSEILTIGGEYFNFEDPSNCKFTIEDIAHALSHICRYNGHCKSFYSVAQHSVIVSNIVPKEFAFQGLMHDAREAFVGDMPTPLKRLIPEYQFYEDLAAAEVHKRFGLPFELDDCVHEADEIAFMTERRCLLVKRDDDNVHFARFSHVKPLDMIIKPEIPATAYFRFLKRFEELTS